MSNIRADTLSTLDGTKSITTDRIAQGVARAWVNFDGTGTVAIRASFNVSSITDNGAGDYTVNFATAMPDANYSAVGNADGNITDSTCLAVIIPRTIPPTVSSFRFHTKSGNSSGAFDSTFITVAVFR